MNKIQKNYCRRRSLTITTRTSSTTMTTTTTAMRSCIQNTLTRTISSLVMIHIVITSILSQTTRSTKTVTNAYISTLPLNTFIQPIQHYQSIYHHRYHNLQHHNTRHHQNTKLKMAISSTELEQSRQDRYIAMNKTSASVWSFDSLFPQPVLDEDAVHEDLYAVKERDEKKLRERMPLSEKTKSKSNETVATTRREERAKPSPPSSSNSHRNSTITTPISSLVTASTTTTTNTNTTPSSNLTINPTLTRMVQDRILGYRRTPTGEIIIDDNTLTSPDSAVQFRDGIRLGRPLSVNIDRLVYHAKRDFRKNNLKEAKELYERALSIDPFDGRGYLGLSRVYSKRGEYGMARDVLKRGVELCVGRGTTKGNEAGGNPFLLQAWGVLEERMGHLGEAERLYIKAARVKPSHAAAWVSLGQLRTRQLRQNAAAGRACFRTAARELSLANLPPSSHVYTAWASLEYKKANEVARARELYQLALEIDPKCSAALLQWGCMEADKERWDEARELFERVLRFDQRNGRVLQAYARMESLRPGGDSREVIELFERALRVKPRDAGVYQAYGLYVKNLGDIDAARDLLRRGTIADSRHAPAWQAWGVLETHHGTPTTARNIFQQGIWSCAQPGGGQSGGRRCARLWQAWGVLEAQEGDHAAARRCFGRALDADPRNVAAMTAWTGMETSLGNYGDARSIFERSLKRFEGQHPCEETRCLWRNYELMEVTAGNAERARMVYERGMREAFRDGGGVDNDADDAVIDGTTSSKRKEDNKDSSAAREGNTATTAVEDEEEIDDMDEVLTASQKNEVEVVRWTGSNNKDFYDGGQVWLNNGSIEGKMPKKMLKKKKPNNNNKGTMGYTSGSK